MKLKVVEIRRDGEEERELEWLSGLVSGDGMAGGVGDACADSL